MGLYFLEKKCHRISEISFLPSLKAKLLFPVCDEIPCTYNGFATVVFSKGTLHFRTPCKYTDHSKFAHGFRGAAAFWFSLECIHRWAQISKRWD